MSETLSTRNKIQPRLHLDLLDGIRGLAALWVVLNHCWIHVFSDGVYVRTGWKGIAVNWLLYGHLAVDVFIVLSGFCLMLPVVQTGSIKDGVVGFYVRRARRILPTYYASLAICLMLDFVIHEHNQSSWLFMPVSKRAILTNIVLMQDLFRTYANQVNGPTWSVAAEWKIYFLFPLFVWTMRRFGSAATLILAAVIGYGLTGILHFGKIGMPPDHTCPWYVLLFVTGMVASVTAFGQKSGGVARENGRKFWLGALILSGALLGLLLKIFPGVSDMLSGSAGYFPIADAIMGAFTACALILLSTRSGQHDTNLALKVFSWRPLVALGTFSYSLYLIHYPLIFLWVHALGSLHSLFFHQKSVVFALVGIPSIIGASYLFFLVFERPFLNTRRKETFAETARDAVLSPAP